MLFRTKKEISQEEERIQAIIADGYKYLGSYGRERHKLNGLTKQEYIEICKKKVPYLY